MDVYSAISSNKRKTWFVMFFFVLIITTLSYILSKTLGYGLSIVGFALIISGILSIGSFYYSDKLVLSALKAKPVKKENNPELFRIVENLCIGQGLPMPRVYTIDDPSPNAFATGRDPKHAVICVTSGILKILNKTELEGVIAHELSHIKNYDIRLAGIMAILAGTVVIISDMLIRSARFSSRDKGKGTEIIILIGIIFAILSPIAATLIQLAVSRKREYLADASAALLTRYPDGLASALEKLAKDQTPLKSANHATAHLFIEDPFQKDSEKGFLSSIFNTHPPIHNRIRILRSM